MPEADKVLNGPAGKTGAGPQGSVLRSAAYSLIGAFLIPVLAGVFVPQVGFLFQILVLAVALLLPFLLVVWALTQWLMGEGGFLTSLLKKVRPIPPGLVYGSDLKQSGPPYVTVGLILVNVLIHFTVPEEMVERLVFMPYGDPDLADVAVSFIAAAFLHGDVYHLGGNMIFLWTFGSTLEPRVGSPRFALLYFECILISHALVLAGLYFQSMAIGMDFAELLANFHTLGASGAIAGIMGLFAVRCFFARVRITMPIFFLPFLSVPMSLNGLFLVGLFFAMDVSGSVRMVQGDSDMTNYWAHVGGYLGGMALGYAIGLHKAAHEESREAAAVRASDRMLGGNKALDYYREVLKDQKDNQPALEFMFEKVKKSNPPEAARYYGRLIEMYFKTDPKKAVKFFDEHYPNFMNAMSGRTLMRLGGIFFNDIQLEKARWCFDMAARMKGPWQAKSLYSLAETLAAQGKNDMARTQFESVINAYPDTPFEKSARKKITELDG